MLAQLRASSSLHTSVTPLFTLSCRTFTADFSLEISFDCLLSIDCLRWHNAYRRDGLGSNAVPAMKADSQAKKVMKTVADKLMKSNCASIQHSSEAMDAKVRTSILSLHMQSEEKRKRRLLAAVDALHGRQVVEGFRFYGLLYRTYMSM